MSVLSTSARYGGHPQGVSEADATRSFLAEDRGEHVNVVKSLWASVQGDPIFMRRINGWLTIFWIVMIPISAEAGWLHSVVFVSALSLWALVSGHWSAWQAARVEVTQQAEAEKREENPIEERVVDRLIARTSIEEATESYAPGGNIRRHVDALARQLEILQHELNQQIRPEHTATAPHRVHNGFIPR